MPSLAFTYRRSETVFFSNIYLRRIEVIMTAIAVFWTTILSASSHYITRVVIEILSITSLAFEGFLSCLVIKAISSNLTNFRARISLYLSSSTPFTLAFTPKSKNVPFFGNGRTCCSAALSLKNKPKQGKSALNTWFLASTAFKLLSGRSIAKTSYCVTVFSMQSSM